MTSVDELVQEEGAEVPAEKSFLLHEGGNPLLEPRPVGVSTRRPLAMAALSFVMLAMATGGFRSLRSSLARSRSPAHVQARSFEQKFYDASKAYWQAPGRAISGSELWASCQHSHLSTCSSYCCCDEGYYWKSPKTVYQQEQHIIKEAAAGTTAVKAGSAVAAASSVKDASEAFGKAVLGSMTADGQRCVPEAEVPAVVVKALKNSDRIPGSDAWATCSTFTANSHTCGSFCCCQGGYVWSASTEQCAQQI